MNKCGLFVVALYLLYGIAGLWVDRTLSRLHKHNPEPIREATLDTDQARRLFRLSQLWGKWQTAVWLGLFIVAAVLCR
jgi:hypothetical protein